MYKYKLKEGHENRVFINTRTNSDGTLESDVELNSPYLTAVAADDPSPSHVTGVAPQSAQGGVAQAAPTAVNTEQPNDNKENQS